MSDEWAEERAREWLVAADRFDPVWLDTSTEGVGLLGDLAALLREVEAEEHACGDHIKARLDEQMAEVRSVVEEVRGEPDPKRAWLTVDEVACNEILRRLEAL